MKPELKRLTTLQSRHSGALTYDADVYIEGVKVGTVENRGDGGASWYRPSGVDASVSVDKYEDYLKTLPAKLDVPPYEARDLQARTLVDACDKLVEDMLARKVTERTVKRAEQHGHTIALLNTGGCLVVTAPNVEKARQTLDASAYRGKYTIVEGTTKEKIEIIFNAG